MQVLGNPLFLRAYKRSRLIYQKVIQLLVLLSEMKAKCFFALSLYAERMALDSTEMSKQSYKVPMHSFFCDQQNRFSILTQKSLTKAVWSIESSSITILRRSLVA